jgi:hypothetical protein
MCSLDYSSIFATLSEPREIPKKELVALTPQKRSYGTKPISQIQQNRTYCASANFSRICLLGQHLYANHFCPYSAPAQQCPCYSRTKDSHE